MKYISINEICTQLECSTNMLNETKNHSEAGNKKLLFGKKILYDKEQKCFENESLKFWKGGIVVIQHNNLKSILGCPVNCKVWNPYNSLF